MATVQSILTLHERGWSARRIARELQVNRESVSRHVRLATSADLSAGSNPADAPIVPNGASPGRRSDCEPCREIIQAKEAQGLSARRIHQDLVAEHAAVCGTQRLEAFRDSLDRLAVERHHAEGVETRGQRAQSVGGEQLGDRRRQLAEPPWAERDRHPADLAVRSAGRRLKLACFVRASKVLVAAALTARIRRRCGRDPPRGRARQGTRLIDKTPHGHWTTTTLIAALRCDGAINGHLFLGYVRQTLAPALRLGDVVVMGNLSSHKCAGMRDAIAAAGAKLLYLPPYSPGFNPIEQAFSKFKRLLQSAGERTVEGLWQTCGRLVERFTEIECRNYIRHAEYS